MTAQWFGDYEIIKRLRVGGMATLYLARRHGAAGFSRLVALKMVHPHLAEQSNFIEMFVDEARICAQISHPNVVHVEEFGVIDGVHYLVMEYLDGCSVGELLQAFHRARRHLDPELVARIIMQVSAGLHAAHETRDQHGQPLDIIHRDISPSNIFLSTDGNAKLIDFGIAKARNRLTKTQAGNTLKGKCRYVAPEQAIRTAVDRRCDIFSLGIVFWEMLVTRPLFVEDSHVALLKRLHQTEVVPPSRLNPQVPPAIDAIVLAMLRHDPDQRPATAAEVQRRIASAVPGAANREASEVGVLAAQVRDVREARRAARPGTGEPSGSNSYMGFSPTPRSFRPESTPGSADEYRVEVEPTPPSVVETAGTTVLAPRWWARRGVQVGLLGLLGISMIVVLLWGGHDVPEAGAAAAPTHHATVGAATPAEAPKPIGPSAGAPPASPTAPGSSTAVSPPVPTLQQPAVPEPPQPPSPTTVPADEAAAPAITASPPEAATAHPGNAAIKRKPVSRRTSTGAKSEPAVNPAQSARKAQVVNGKQPFSNVEFDDADNARSGPPASNIEQLKKTPITDRPDN